MMRYPLGAVTRSSSRFPSPLFDPPLTHIPPVVYTETEVFNLCSIRRRLPSSPSHSSVYTWNWVDQGTVYPARSSSFPRPLWIFSFIQLLSCPFYSQPYRSRTVFAASPSHTSFVHTSHSLHCCMLFNSLHGRFAPAPDSTAIIYTGTHSTIFPSSPWSFLNAVTNHSTLPPRLLTFFLS
jgi:hypothetical protein